MKFSIIWKLLYKTDIENLESTGSYEEAKQTPDASQVEKCGVVW